MTKTSLHCCAREVNYAVASVKNIQIHLGFVVVEFILIPRAFCDFKLHTGGDGWLENKWHGQGKGFH